MIRFWEIMPGALAWFTLIGLTLLSWRAPVVVVVFILLYDLYWLLKLIYLFSHLRSSFAKMKANLKIDWLMKLKKDNPENWEKIRHLVILPAYRENYEIIRQAFLSLAEANYPKEKILTVLAIEERGGEVDAESALKIEKEFNGAFKGLLITRHPADLPNELAGKGSNQAWAAKEALSKLIDPSGVSYGDVLVSVLDIDTRVGPDYFGILTHKFLNSSYPTRSSYQPIPLFINNIHETPFFARLVGFSSSFWQLMQESRPEQLVTFSSHSMPLKALVDVGFWETDIVSEDSRIFFQCLAHYKGDWRVEPLLYPVHMDAVIGETFFAALKNLYKQQRRWAWGAENLARAAKDFSKDKAFPAKIARFWKWTLFDGIYSWSTSSFIIFLFGWFPNLLGDQAFRTSVLSYNLPRLTGWILNLSSIGVIASAFLSIIVLYTRLKGFKRWRMVWYLLEWILTPLVFIIFSAFPALDAQTRLMLGGRFRLGYWRTPKDSPSAPR